MYSEIGVRKEIKSDLEFVSGGGRYADACFLEFA